MNKKITISSNLKNIKPVVDDVIGFLRNKRVDKSDIFDIRLSLEESLINAIKYGNRLDEKLDVLVDFSYRDNMFTVSVEDNGNGFDYHCIPDPTKAKNVLKASGRGIYLITHLMDDVKFNRKGNRITMIKHIKRNEIAKA